MDYGKLSPLLVAAVDDFQRQGRAALARHQGLVGVVSVEPVMKPPRVVVFLHAARGASLDHLAELGVVVNGGGDGGGVATGIVPLDAVDRLSSDPAIERIVPARALRPLMDVAAGKVDVPKLWDTGLTGKGVVVGVVDSGIEPSHPSFAGRLLRVWDQTLNGPGVPEGGYGAELTGELVGLSRDTNGHGTHVAGIAASADATFRGVAPEADLVIVKSDLLTAHIADGVRYIFRVARELGRPAVVNLSLGGHGDGHDGTDSLSLVIDAEVGPGRIVCCAAGNEGNDNIHARVDLRRNSTRTIPLATVVAAPGQRPPRAALNGWYAAADQIEVAVVSPTNIQTPFQPVIPGDDPLRTYQLPDGEVTVITPGPDPANGDINFLVLIDGAPTPAGGSPAKQSAWRLRLRSRRIAKGRVDVWTIDERTAQFTGPAVADSMKVGSPGSASRAITVAAYTTRSSWQDIFGDPHETGLDEDDIAEFSSEGPRRDGVEKPDVAAPGAMIVSALSVHSPVTPAFLIDSLHTVMAGTSQACPFVSGLVALLLERDPGLTPEAAKQLLRDNSRIPGKRKGTFDAKWGYGLIDAGALARRRPPPKKAPAKKAPAKKAPKKSVASPSRSRG